jgi:hypothetical protein
MTSRRRSVQAYQALKGATANITVSASSQRVAVLNASGRHQVRVYNAGTATVWIAFGDDTVTASATADIPIGPGGTEVFSVEAPGAKPLNVAAIAAAATGVIYFTPGAGL